ncbi:S9 family peptidase [Lentimicrobium sp. L6]|uniref:prolyl oligopeptidase family serine peptidase n=1 Tax=Lentimicrobium sp. L6 TaxID=2735916 RepID=UPI001555CD3D|nr:prolyl oligopeptidase family serine peptidase [Lentimicrobium sp. L6]NPD85792.1 S9 family peptidase [Lentimicrobium sp. L6]
MKKYIFIAMAAILGLYSCNQKQEKMLNYPISQKVDTVDIYHGVEVADPFRWLEDDNSDSTKAWVSKQNKVTNDYLAEIPFRQKIKDRLTEIWDYPKYGMPFKKGDYWYFYKNDGLQPQYVIYRMKTLDGEPELFLDPNTFSEDGTVALSGLSFSKNGKLCTYSLSSGGSDWREIFVMHVESKTKLEDHLKWIKFSGMSWYKDGFYYSRYDEPKEGDELKGVNENSKVFYHKAGTAQSADQLIYEDKENPMFSWNMGTTEDEKYLILSGHNPSARGNSLYFKEADDPKSEFIAIQEDFEHNTWVLDNEGEDIFIMTNKDAPRNRVYKINANDPSETREVIPQTTDVLNNVGMAGGKLLVSYMHDASSKAYVYNLDGSLEHQIKLPAIGSISGFSGDKESNTAFYSFTSFTYPSMTFKYDIKNNKTEVFRKSGIDIDIDQFETKQVFYTSKDGTKVPMFIVHKKGLVLNGTNPTLLYGYGGFNVSLTPYFSISNLVLLENDGVYALPNIRGGGEYGEEWHQGGTQLNKQNVFDDFIAAAEYLIDNGYTSSEKLAIRGGSNGGLLVGACMTQRPELFKVAIPQVGVMDMLRYHKFTIGYYWVPDYGSSDDKIQFENLIKYSPLHNLKARTCYPATMITTADHDDRVVPAHSFKFAAELQSKQSCANPTVIRIETKAGHGAGKSTEKIIEEATDIWSFMFYNMGVEAYPEK